MALRAFNMNLNQSRGKFEQKVGLQRNGDNGCNNCIKLTSKLKIFDE